MMDATRQSEAVHEIQYLSGNPMSVWGSAWRKDKVENWPPAVETIDLKSERVSERGPPVPQGEPSSSSRPMPAAPFDTPGEDARLRSFNLVASKIMQILDDGVAG